jgi:hypothetical protein
LENIKPRLIDRPNEPDFSDLFYLSEEEYDQLLAEWAAIGVVHKAQGPAGPNDVNDVNDINDVNGIGGTMDYSKTMRANDMNDPNDMNDLAPFTDPNDPNSLVVRGPYGPSWPLVTEPLEFEIGSAKVTIEIEDENAKYPVGWMLMEDEKVQRELLAGFETFCEWMDVNDPEIDSLVLELEDIKEIKPFTLEFKAVTKRTPISRRASRRSKTMRRGKKRRRTARRTKNVQVSAAKQFAEQAADLSRLFHSSLVDAELLARPTIESDRRTESALKYMGMWGSSKININTAPRQVLEAAFSFGGDAVEIADGIIRRRRTEPFTDIDDLKSELFGFSESIRKCENYITTTSTFFTIRVTAVSGVAEASVVIAVTKEGRQTRKIAIIGG